MYPFHFEVPWGSSKLLLRQLDPIESNSRNPTDRLEMFLFAYLTKSGGERNGSGTNVPCAFQLSSGGFFQTTDQTSIRITLGKIG